MANSPYSYLFDDWNPVQLDPDAQEPPAPWELPDANTYGPPLDVEGGLSPINVDYWQGDPGAAAQNWAQAYLPFAQLSENQREFTAEFTEAQNRFWNQNAWSQQRDTANLDLAQRQQLAQEQQASWGQQNFQSQLQAQALNDDVSRRVALGELDLAQAQQILQEGQWNQSFQAQTTNDSHARKLASDRLAYEMQQSDRQLTLNEQQQKWSEIYQQQQLQLRAEEIDASREAARFQTYGRGARPGQWAAQW